MKTFSAWQISAQEALAAVRMAVEEATAEVPEELRTEQWVAAKHMMQASAWEEMGLKHRLPVLVSLRLLAIARAALEGALDCDKEPTQAPDLRLGKMRQ